MFNKSHHQLVKTALSRPNVRKEYIALEEEFELLEEMLKARLKAGKSQEEVARAMKTSTSSVLYLPQEGLLRENSCFF